MRKVDACCISPGQDMKKKKESVDTQGNKNTIQKKGEEWKDYGSAFLGKDRENRPGREIGGLQINWSTCSWLRTYQLLPCTIIYCYYYYDYFHSEVAASSVTVTFSTSHENIFHCFVGRFVPALNDCVDFHFCFQAFI